MSAATYDGDNLRTSSTSTPTGGSASTQNYVWDTSGSAPQLVMDSTKAYVYGTGTAPIEQVNLSSGTLTYLLSDQSSAQRPRHSSTPAAPSPTPPATTHMG